MSYFVDVHGNPIELTEEFSVIEGFERSPPPIDRVEDVEHPKRLDLREISIGSVVQFHGEHPDSIYICRLSGSESDRKIKIWLKGRGNGAIGSIDALRSRHSMRQWPWIVEKGVLEIGKNYVIPTFKYDKDDNLFLDHLGSRTEPYSKIFVLTPDHPEYRNRRTRD